MRCNLCRENWADIAKLIAIFFMVWGHIGTEPNIRNFIYTFHMPLFFFISGYFEKAEKKSVNFLLYKNFKALLIPYLSFSIFALFYCWIYPYNHPEFYPGVTSVQDFIIATFKGLIFMDDSISYRYFMPNSPLWFLIALFINKVLFIFLNKVFYGKKWQVLMWGGIIILSLIIFPVLSSIKYYSIDSAVMGFSLYVAGYLFNSYNLLCLIRSRSWIIFIMTLLYMLFFAYRNGSVDMDGGAFGNSIILFYINAIIGIIMVISFSELVSRVLNGENNILYFLGRNTLIILGLHGLFILMMKLVFKVLGLPLNYYFNFIMALFVLVLSIPAIYLIRRNFPFMIGVFKKEGKQNKG